jgi:hypothetical protein
MRGNAPTNHDPPPENPIPFNAGTTHPGWKAPPVKEHSVSSKSSRKFSRRSVREKKGDECGRDFPDCLISSKESRHEAVVFDAGHSGFSYSARR